MAFTHLHLHTHYSLTDAIVKPNELFEKLASLGQNSVAMTDHGNMFGAVEMFKLAKKANVKLIVGCEAYVAPGKMKDKKKGDDGERHFNHLLLLAKNEIGYKNLMKLCSAAYLKGFYYRPRIDKEILEQYKDGLVCTTACISGEIPRLILKGRYDDAKECIKWFRNMLGEGNFYLEIEDHGIKEQAIVNEFLLSHYNELGVPVVAANDVHYINQEDYEAHDIMLCIGTNKLQSDQDRKRYESDQFYLKSEQEMRSLFQNVQFAIDNTTVIANQCNFELDLKTYHFPKFESPEQKTSIQYLKEMVYDGAKKRYGEQSLASGSQIKQRIDYELSVIEGCKFEEYFLVVYDFVKWAKDNNIAVGPGRGSAAGSIVVYCLNITDVEPLRYGLFFERFLNPDRISMPDIDIDFCFFRRQDVINYVIEKYGKENVSPIITFGILGAKSVINAVAKPLGIPFQEGQKISKLVSAPLDTLENNMKEESLRKCFDGYLNQKLLNICLRLQGCIKYAGTHASGIVITTGGLDSFVPLYCDSSGQIATQYDMDSIDSAGMLKVDFLGLRTMTVIDETIKLVKRRYGTELDMNKIPLDDPNAFQIIERRETQGVFQLESSGMRNLISRMDWGGRKITDIIALVALFRPGPLMSGMVNKFVDRKAGYEQVTYAHKLMENILQETYGVIVYQEQIMQLAASLCGFTMARGDVLRKAMGKKIPQMMIQMREEFVQGGMKTVGMQREVLDSMFTDIEKFAEYGFNKAHSTCYAIIAYQTAFLKGNYSVEFMASLLTSVSDKEDKVKQYFFETKRLGIEVLPPDINESYKGFEVVANNKIRFSMSSIKNLGGTAVDKILEERSDKGSFRSLEDFCSKVKISSKVLDSLIKCGAFDSIGKRPQLLSIAEKAIELGKINIKNTEKGQKTLFDDMDDGGEESLPLPDIPDWSNEEKGKNERELLGVFISYDPVTKGIPLFQKMDQQLQDIENVSDGSKVVVAGVIDSIKQKKYQGTKMMLTAILSDHTGEVEIIFWDDSRAKYLTTIAPGLIVILKGRYSAEGCNISVFNLKVAEDSELMQKGGGQMQYFDIDVTGKVRWQIEKLREIISLNQGRLPVRFYLDNRYIDSGVKLNDDTIVVKEIQNLGFNCRVS